MKDLVTHIVTALVDHPDEVEVKATEGTRATVPEVRVHPDDLGRVIGRDGRIINSVRILLGAIGMKLNKRFTLQVVKEYDAQK